MLIEFKVANFRSFKDEETFSMVASPDESLPCNVVRGAQGSKYDLLKSAVVYGPNASGKSNFIKALQTMIGLVLRLPMSTEKDAPSPYNPFQLDSNYFEKPGIFIVTFLLEGVENEYGVEVDKKGVKKEWLKTFPKGQPRLLFERDRSRKDEFYFNPNHWKGPGKTLVEKTREDVLFISVADSFNNKTARDILSWFRMHTTCMMDPSFYYLDSIFSKRFLANEEGKTRVLAMLQKADPSLAGMGLSQRDRAIGNAPPDIDKDFFSLAEKDTDLVEGIRNLDEKYPVFTLHERDNQGNISVASFWMQDESDGTQRLFQISGMILESMDGNRIILSDEFDLRLHPLLARDLIEMFHDPEINSHDSQLIFTTHNISLLDLSLFRRDQIWFTERGDGGGTEMYSLWDFKGADKARRNANVARQYLAGKFGAVPALDGIPE